MTPPLALLTGGNSGIGRAAATHLADAGWELILASRDAVASQRTAGELADRAHRSVAQVERLDLAAPASCRELAQRLVASGRAARLGAVVCNAGLSWSGPLRRTAAGVEQNIAVNLVGHAILVGALLPSLPAGVRLVFTGSGTARLDRDAGPMRQPRWPGAAALLRPDHDDAAMAGRCYPTSKLALALWTQELRRRLRAGRVVGPAGARVLLYEPGLVPGTGLAREESGLSALVFDHLMPHLGWLMDAIRTPEQAGAALAALVAGEPDPGQLHTVDGPERMPAVYTAAARGAELWGALEGVRD